jgi:hypothetical protein
MKKADYTQARFEADLKEISQEYSGRYDSQYQTAWNSTKDDEDWQPAIVLREIKEADPQYKKNLEMMLAKRKEPIGLNCCLE